MGWAQSFLVPIFSVVILYHPYLPLQFCHDRLQVPYQPFSSSLHTSLLSCGWLRPVKTWNPKVISASAAHLDWSARVLSFQSWQFESPRELSKILDLFHLIDLGCGLGISISGKPYDSSVQFEWKTAALGGPILDTGFPPGSRSWT
jgi:hypothetical protein